MCHYQSECECSGVFEIGVADTCIAKFVRLMLSTDAHVMPATMSRPLPDHCIQCALQFLHARTPSQSCNLYVS